MKTVQIIKYLIALGAVRGLSLHQFFQLTDAYLLPIELSLKRKDKIKVLNLSKKSNLVVVELY